MHIGDLEAVHVVHDEHSLRQEALEVARDLRRYSGQLQPLSAVLEVLGFVTEIQLFYSLGKKEKEKKKKKKKGGNKR